MAEESSVIIDQKYLDEVKQKEKGGRFSNRDVREVLRGGKDKETRVVSRKDLEEARKVDETARTVDGIRDLKQRLQTLREQYKPLEAASLQKAKLTKGGTGFAEMSLQDLALKRKIEKEIMELKELIAEKQRLLEQTA